MSSKPNYNKNMPKLIERHSMTIGLVTLLTAFAMVTGFAYKVGGAEREIRDTVQQNKKTIVDCQTNFEKHVDENNRTREEMRKWMREVNKNLTKINTELEHLNDKGSK